MFLMFKLKGDGIDVKKYKWYAALVTCSHFGECSFRYYVKLDKITGKYYISSCDAEHKNHFRT